jgi:hypothetical protein
MKEIKQIIDTAAIAKLNNLGCTPTERSSLRRLMIHNLFSFFETEVHSLLVDFALEWSKYGGMVKDYSGTLLIKANLDQLNKEIVLHRFAYSSVARITFSLLNTELKCEFRINNDNHDYTNGYNLECIFNDHILSKTICSFYEDILVKIKNETLIMLATKFSVENFK